jgi:hypothetical protein
MKFKQAKMETVKSTNPFPNPTVADTAAITMPAFVVRQNKGAGPKGQTSNQQIKKVKFTGVK